MSTTLSILADENIPFVVEAFSSLGHVTTMPGRKMTNADVGKHDVLLVRSVTQVDEALLAGEKLKFIGTATIGTDHVDTTCLADKGIAFSSAPGSNALSVAEYITAALLELIKAGIITPPDITVGVVGVGNVGSRVAKKVEALGFKALRNDPPLKDKTGDKCYVDLDNILAQSDIITVHTPLIDDGPYRTKHLVDKAFLAKTKKGAVLINSSRGKVVDEKALIQALDSGHISAAILDVWYSEPNLSVEMLKRTFIASPHIAGYSYDGKVRGTQMLYDALTKVLDIKSTWRMENVLPEPVIPEVLVPDSGNVYEGVRQVVSTVYDIREDDGRMRKIGFIGQRYQGVYFDYLRKTYPIRREFSNTKLSENLDSQAGKILQACGFRV